MPITVSAPTGAFTSSAQSQILPRLTDALVSASGSPQNPFLMSLIGGTVNILDPSDIYAGGENRRVIMVELKLPNIGLPTLESRAAFISATTDIIAELAHPAHQRQDIWVNILNAPDGAWGVGGHAFRGEELVAEVLAAAGS